MNLVELLGRYGLLQHHLQQQAEPHEYRSHEHPRDRRPGHHYRHDGRRPDQRREVGEHLVPQDQHALAQLELAAHQETEVEQRPGAEEIREGEREQRQNDRAVRLGRNLRDLQHEGVHAVRHDERDHLPPEIDPRDPGGLAVPRPVGDQRAPRDRHCGRGESHEQAPRECDEAGLREIGVLAQGDVEAAQRNAGAE